MSRRRRTGITVTDQFCGAGGSSIGAVKAGLQLRLALNHWALAIETHNTNFPDADHDCCDVSAADPRRYPSTDILITSPECTTHSPAGGTRRAVPQRDLFRAREADPSMVRSRATMWDVPRFAEFHQYNVIIVENVFEVTRWVLFPEWLAAMAKLGYDHRVVSLNSMFCYPTPQSRDRVYVVFWKRGNRAPQLDYMPPAPCARCQRVVPAVQAWKNGRHVGKYRQQYAYVCPTCAAEVTPYYFAALNALDLSLTGERIGDRPRPLRPRTLERIRYGLERYGSTALIIRTNMTSGVGCPVRNAAGEPFDTQPASAITGLVTPAFLVETAFTHAEKRRARDLSEALPAQGGQPSTALVGLPFLVNGHMSRRVYDATQPLSAQSASRAHDAVVMPAPLLVGTANGQSHSSNVRGGQEPMAARTTAQDLGVVVPPAAIVAQRSHNVPKSLGDPLPGVCTGGHHILVSGAALISLRSQDNLAKGLDAPLPVQVASCAQQWVASPQPFLVSYYGTDNMHGAVEPVHSLTTLDRHALVEPDAELELEDCYFRMLQPHEIGAAMAFPGDYRVLGTKRDQVKQYGNAVTPPVMEWLIRQAVASLAPEKAA